MSVFIFKGGIDMQYLVTKFIFKDGSEMIADQNESSIISQSKTDNELDYIIGPIMRGDLVYIPHTGVRTGIQMRHVRTVQIYEDSTHNE